MLKRLKNYLNQFPVVRSFRLLLKTDMKLVYKACDLNTEYYLKAKASGDRELEHQIGRLTNFKNILSDIDTQKLTGDIIEFGSWQGFSLLWIAYLAERQGLFFTKIIGVDGFVGLPNAEGLFKKGMFKNTSHQSCLNNIKFSGELYKITKNNVFVERFLYSEKERLTKRLNVLTQNKFCFIHIDCDISNSVKEVFALIRDGNLIADTCYVVFDDYGCVESYANTVDGLVNELGDEWVVKEYSRTVLTKTFVLERSRANYLKA